MPTPDTRLPEDRFERRARLRSLGATLVVHGCLLLLMVFWTCSVPSEPPLEELTEITWGSGGNPNVDAPDGPATRGNPDAAMGGSTTAPEGQNPARERDPQKVRTPRAASATPDRVPTPDTKSSTPSAPTTAPSRENSTAPSNGSNASDGRTADGTSGPMGDRPDGTGTKPAGGSGGASVGSATGLGTRGWAARPRPAYPSGANVEGTVVLRFTVMPNGDIVNVSAVKRADPALVSSAIAALRRSRFRPLPDDVPQVSVTGTIPMYFRLDD